MKQNPIYRYQDAGLTRYESAPETLLSSIVENVTYEGGEFIIGSGSGSESNNIHKNRFFGGDNNSSSSLTSHSSCFQNSNFGGGLMRQSSLPAGSMTHLYMIDGGFSINGVQTVPKKRLKSQLSLSKQDSFSQYPDMRDSSEEASGFFGQSFSSNNFSVGSYDDINSITFPSSLSKRTKYNDEDLFDSQYSLASVENLLQAQQDTAICKIRAKRGCATNPRSLAERERRTRISKRINKLDGFIPNIDKQTSQSEKIDLAMLHIKELQKQIEDLKQERANCTCSCKLEIL